MKIEVSALLFSHVEDFHESVSLRLVGVNSRC